MLNSFKSKQKKYSAQSPLNLRAVHCIAANLGLFVLLCLNTGHHKLGHYHTSVRTTIVEET